MKKRIAVILALSLSIVTLMCGSLSVSAASYVIEEDFLSVSDCEFLAPGDMDADGQVVADDLVLLKQLLLNPKKSNIYTDVYKEIGEASKYSDINGDGFINVIDLVRQKKNLAENSAFVSGGVMSLNGNSAYKGDFTSSLSANAVYDISITYKSDSPIKVKMADLEKEFVFEASQNTKTVVKTFETPSVINDAQGIDFQIIGVVSIDDISVVRVNLDNDLADNW